MNDKAPVGRFNFLYERFMSNICDEKPLTPTSFFSFIGFTLDKLKLHIPK